MEKYFGREFGRKRRWINDYITKFERKQSDLKQTNREVIMLLDEEELGNDIRRTIQKISNELQSIKINDNLLNVNKTSCAAPVKAQGVKLSSVNPFMYNVPEWSDTL